MRNQLISFFLFSMLSLSAQAEVILSPVSVVSNSMGEGLPLSSPIENVINGSGLSSAFSSGVTPFDSVSATHLFVPPLSWSSQSGSTTGSIVFDLGADYLIEQFALWQGFAPALNANQVASVKLYTTDQLSVANDISSNAWVDVNDGAGTQKEYLVQQGATPPYPMQVFDLEDSTGRYVRLDIWSNHGGTFTATFGEIAFDVSAVAAVPEPSTYAMLLAGLGLLGFAKRREQS